MELIVAEKPKVAQKIATAIGDKVQKKVYNKVAYYEAVCNGKDVVIAPAVGHVYTLAEKKKSSGYPVFDIEWFPAYEISKQADYTKPYVMLIKNLAKKADTFVSACDYDIEGSTIAWNVFRFATNIKQGKRMKFSALTDGELRSAYDDRGEFDYYNAYAGETRHILDWYYGINLSRALMSAIRKASRYRVMSIGRVQGPALGMVSQLEKSIRAFVPTPYWELTTLIKDTLFTHKTARFIKEDDAKKSMERTSSDGTVETVEKREIEVPPSPCFDLTSLQLEAHKQFKYSPSRTLEIAQNLYEASLITYPRTSSQKIPPTIKVAQIIEKLGQNPEYTELAKMLQDNKWFKPLQGKKEDPAHPAIHPTGQAGKIAGPEKNLYDLIVRRFLAVFAPAAKRERTRIEVNAGGEVYAVSGTRTIEKAWIEFYDKYYKSEDKEIPEFKPQEHVRLEELKKTKKETNPPKRYTEASIVSELEKRHLGTKATRSVIVDTLFKRDYLHGKPIEVTDLGLAVCEVLQKYAPEILDEALTRKIEEEMEGIQEGKVDRESVICEGREILTQLLDRWKKNEAKIGAELSDALKLTQNKESLVGPCDKCGKQLRIIRMKDGRQFIGCHGYPDCKNTYPLPAKAAVTVLDKQCPVCNKPTVFVKRGSMKFGMCIDPNCPSKDKWKKKGVTDAKN